MSVEQPWVLALALLGGGGLVAGYVVVQRRRTAALAAVGIGAGRSAVRRHLPYGLFLAALVVLLLGLARPTATLALPRLAGTVVLVFDISQSMTADDVAPDRLEAAKAAAARFVEAQPDSVDIGVVAFGEGALTTLLPGADHEQALAAIDRLRPAGGTSLGQAVLGGLSAVVGEPVSLPDDEAGGSGSGGSDSGGSGSDGSDAGASDLGYWGSATIVVFSDGENTTGPDPGAAAALAATAGVHIETVGVGTAAGATVEVDGYQVATALDAELLTTIAETTNGSYHAVEDAAQLDDVAASLDLRNVARAEPVELTAGFVLLALALLTAGGLLMVRWYGRLV